VSWYLAAVIVKQMLTRMSADQEVKRSVRRRTRLTIHTPPIAAK